MGEPQVSLIVPTLNEGQNLPLLLPRVAAALAPREYEVLIIDDGSQDNTVHICERAAREYPVTLVVREHPKDGLSGAVMHGMAMARGQYLVVMDADLQHPPEKLRELLEPLEKGEADFVIGSRYARGGQMAQRFGFWRRMLSRAATALSRPIVRGVCDPMSGFFALRRDCYAKGQRLTPLGYKIGLEILRKCPVRDVREIPICFAARAHGESKLTFCEQFRYLEHLSRLYDFSYPRASPIGKFLIALACSWTAASAAYAAMVWRGIGLAWAAAAAYALAVAVTAVFHLRYCRTQREFLACTRPWQDFWTIAAVEWASCAAAAMWLVHRLNAPEASEIFLLSFSLATIVRYILRKELLMDIRGLRKEIRKEEIAGRD